MYVTNSQPVYLLVSYDNKPETIKDKVQEDVVKKKDVEYKNCIVPLCKGNTVSNPDKLFIPVPNDIIKRRQWLKAAWINPSDYPPKMVVYMCEDHFNLEEDIDNYVECKLMGTLKRLKNNVVPRKFDCQPNRSLVLKGTQDISANPKKYGSDLNKRSCPTNSDRSTVKRKYCVVPFCKSTSTHNPHKFFFRLPYDDEQRTLWLQAARRNPNDISTEETTYVCEDHFNMEEDVENRMEHKMLGTQQILKKDVFPHRFDCQIGKNINLHSILEFPALIDETGQQLQFITEPFLSTNEQIQEDPEIFLTPTEPSIDTLQLDLMKNGQEEEEMDLISKCISLLQDSDGCFFELTD